MNANVCIIKNKEIMFVLFQEAHQLPPWLAVDEDVKPLLVQTVIYRFEII